MPLRRRHPDAVPEILIRIESARVRERATDTEKETGKMLTFDALTARTKKKRMNFEGKPLSCSLTNSIAISFFGSWVLLSSLPLPRLAPPRPGDRIWAIIQLNGRRPTSSFPASTCAGGDFYVFFYFKFIYFFLLGKRQLLIDRPMILHKLQKIKTKLTLREAPDHTENNNSFTKKKQK